MKLLAAALCLLACGPPAPVQPPSNKVEAPPLAVVEEPEVTECQRYHALRGKTADCEALSDEVRRDLEQWDTDMLASVSESGMDGSTPVDEERLCEEAADHIVKVATQPCGL